MQDCPCLVILVQDGLHETCCFDSRTGHLSEVAKQANNRLNCLRARLTQAPKRHWSDTLLYLCADQLHLAKCLFLHRWPRCLIQTSVQL